MSSNEEAKLADVLPESVELLNNVTETTPSIPIDAEPLQQSSPPIPIPIPPAPVRPVEPVVEPISNLHVFVFDSEFVFPVSISAHSQTVRWLAIAAVQRRALFDAASTGSRSSMRIGATSNLSLAVPYGVVLVSTGELVSPTLSIFELHRRIMHENEKQKEKGHIIAIDKVRVLLTEKELNDASKISTSKLLQKEKETDSKNSKSEDLDTKSVLEGGVRSLWQAAAYSGSIIGRHMTRQNAQVAKVTTIESDAVFRIIVKQRRIEECFHVLNRLHALCTVEGQGLDYTGIASVMAAFWSILRFSELTKACEMAGSGLQRKRDEYPLKMNIVASFPHIIRLLHHFGEGGGEDGVGGEDGDLFTLQHHEWIHFLSTLKIIPREVTLDKANSIFEQCSVTYKEEQERSGHILSRDGKSTHVPVVSSTKAITNSNSNIKGSKQQHNQLVRPIETDKVEPCLTFSECIEAFLRIAIDCHAHEVDSSNGQRSTIQRCLDRFLTSHALHFSFKLVTGKLNRSLYDSSFRHWVNSNNRLKNLQKVYAYYSSEKAEVQEFIKRDLYGKGLHLPAQRNSLKLRSFLTILVHAGLAPAILLGTPEQQKKDADQNKGRKLPPGTPEPLTMKDIRNAFYGAQLLNDSASNEDEILSKDREDDPWQRLVFWGFFEAIARIAIQKWSTVAGITDSNPNTSEDELQRVGHILLKDQKTIIDHLLKDIPMLKANGEQHFRDPHHHEHHLQLHRALHAASHVALSVLHPPEAHSGKDDSNSHPSKHVDNRHTRRGSIIFGDIVAIHHGRTEHGDHSHGGSHGDKHFFGRHHAKIDDANVHGMSQSALIEKLRLERIEAFKVVAQQKSADILKTLKTVDTSKPLPDAQNEVFRTFIQWAMDAVSKLASHLGEATSPVVHSASDLVILSNTYAISTRATLDDTTLKRPTTVPASGISSPTPIHIDIDSKVSDPQRSHLEYEEMAKMIATDLTDDGTSGANRSGTNLHTSDLNANSTSSSTSLTSQSNSSGGGGGGGGTSSTLINSKLKSSETMTNRARRNSVVAGALPPPTLFPVEVTETHITGIQSPIKNAKGFLDPEVDIVSRASPIKAAFNFKMKTNDPTIKDAISPIKKKSTLF